VCERHEPRYVDVKVSSSLNGLILLYPPYIFLLFFGLMPYSAIAASCEAVSGIFATEFLLECLTSIHGNPRSLKRPGRGLMSVFAVAIGGEADMPFCTAHVRL
jgi:hypothetical protein